VAALALALLKQRERWPVYAALVPVMAGLVIATGAEPSFHVVGFAATVGATVLRALKTVIQVRELRSSTASSRRCFAIGSCEK
jgi:drug/metabolite transporter (DMT)-like permease